MRARPALSAAGILDGFPDSDRAEIVAFLTAKWARDLDYALRKNLWAFAGNRIAVRFQYEGRDAAGQWGHSYGNELWEFNEHGGSRRHRRRVPDSSQPPDSEHRARGTTLVPGATPRRTGRRPTT